MAALASFVSGCSSVAPMMPFAATETAQQRAEELEPMLQTAGFHALPATTSEQKRRIAALPALRMGYYLDKSGRPNYWMADPDYCACLFHGDEDAYLRYQRLEIDDMRAEHDRQAMQAQRAGPPPFMMGPGGPPGPGVTFGGGGFGFSL